LQPTVLKAPFFEQFTDDWGQRWVTSKAKKEDPKTDEDWAYVGEWAVEEPHVFKGIEGDKGLVVKNPAAHHAISAKFNKPIDNKGKTLVVQYEVKLQSMDSLDALASTWADWAQTVWSVVGPT
jgi:calnexin